MKNVSKGESVLVTGGTGSLGSALIPSLLDAGARVRVLSRDEKKQLDLRREYDDVETVLGDVRDPRAVRLALAGVETVIHAASLKYVDVSERQPTEYALTNVFGTVNVLDACQCSDAVRRVVGISTDKVPHAVNTYGLTKALLEKLFVEAHANRKPDEVKEIEVRHYNRTDRVYGKVPGCSFVVARYGNVVGSRGSVVPFWAEQRRKGLPLSVTDPTMTRFFFTLDDAVRLIDVALASPSGTVVAQPMPATTLGDLARAMSGFRYHDGLTGDEWTFDRLAEHGFVRVVGRRPGEKVHERLLTADEMARTERVGDHLRYDPLGPPAPADWNVDGYTSDRARRLTDAELRGMLDEWLSNRTDERSS